MARSDKSAFQSVLIESEEAMDAIFDSISRELGRELLAVADGEGQVPESALPRLRQKVARTVFSAFLGANNKPFDDDGRGLAPYPKMLEGGIAGMFDLATLRSATAWHRLPDDLLEEIRGKWKLEASLSKMGKQRQR